MTFMPAHLSGLCVARALDLALALLGEGDAEDADRVAIRGLDVHVGLNQRLPLAHHGAELVGGEIHALPQQRGDAMPIQQARKANKTNPCKFATFD